MSQVTSERATFNPLIRPYLVVTGGIALIATVVGIPLALIWFLGVGQWWARHYFDKLECELTDKTLRFRKGIFVQFEKTIPLENIQDVSFIEGPILRRFNLSTLKFETAGAGHAGGAQMHLTGIVGAQEFRNRILAARDALKHRVAPAVQADDAAQQSLVALQSIDAKLERILARLEQR